MCSELTIVCYIASCLIMEWIIDLIYITYHDNKPLAELGSAFVLAPKLKYLLSIKSRGSNQLWLSMWFFPFSLQVFYFESTAC